MKSRVLENIKKHKKLQYEQSIENERRKLKRGFDSIDTSIPVSTMNRELLRFAFNQSEGRLSREEVHDIVERCDGTVAGVTILLEARMSDFIIVQPSQRATPNSFSALTPSTNPSGSSSTNHFRLLSDTADEEEDGLSNNDNYVSFIFAFCLYYS